LIKIMEEHFVLIVIERLTHGVKGYINMRICAWGNDSGAKHWRLTDPLKYLAKRGHKIIMSEKGINEAEVSWADICIVQSCTDKDGIALLRQYQVEKKKKIIVECDDGLDVNDDSPFKEDHQRYEAKFVITRTMEIADMVTTTTQYLADQLRVYNDNVVILPNSLDLERWDMPYRENTSGKIRIGWAGSITHLNDVKMIVKPLKKICKEYPRVQLIIIGDPRVAELFEGCPVEFMLGVPFEVWPSKLMSLQLDIGLAPLRNTYFNKCKSNIKWIEYSIASVPGIYSPIVYQLNNEHFDGIYGQIAENEDQWYRFIKNYIICPDLREDIAKRARSCVTTSHTLRTTNHLWEEAYKSLYV
jgi:glycosyltransferase involved in cell wall biosynthesis